MTKTEDVKKDIRLSRILSFIEGVVFFMAAVCCVMADNAAGYIAGAMLSVVAATDIYMALYGKDRQFAGLGTAIVDDETVEEYGQRTEEEKSE